MASQAFDAAVADEVKKANDCQSQLKASFLQIKLSADAIMKYLADDRPAMEEMSKKLEESTKQLVYKAAYVDAWIKALNDLKADRAVRQEIERAGEADRPLPKLDAVVKAKIDARFKPNQVKYEGHELMKNLYSILKIGNRDDEDEELQVLSSQLDNEQGLICPITTTFFEDPVKSRVCNHVYSRMAIEALIKRNRRNEVQVCPVVGCGKQVRKEDLQPDQEKALMVQRHQRQQMTTQLTQHDDAEIIED